MIAHQEKSVITSHPTVAAKNANHFALIINVLSLLLALRKIIRKFAVVVHLTKVTVTYLVTNVSAHYWH